MICLALWNTFASMFASASCLVASKEPEVRGLRFVPFEEACLRSLTCSKLEK